MDVPVRKIHQEIVDSAPIEPQERTRCMFEEPQVAAKLLEVIKVPNSRRTSNTRSFSGEAGSFSVQNKCHDQLSIQQSKSQLVQLTLL